MTTPLNEAQINQIIARLHAVSILEVPYALRDGHCYTAKEKLLVQDVQSLIDTVEHFRKQLKRVERYSRDQVSNRGMLVVQMGEIARQAIGE